MNNLLEYRGYCGTVEYSSAGRVLFGKVLGINSLLSYEGESVRALKQDFELTVDDYLASCAERGIEPEKAYRGKFNVRVSPEVHKKLVIYSASHGKTLNSTVEEAIRAYIGR